MLPFKNLISIDPDSSLSIYLKISNAIIELISKGVLHPETRLPSTRSLSEMLGVHRKTVVAAYDELLSQGWIETKGPKGTFISQELPRIEFVRAEENVAIVATKPQRLLYDHVIDDGHPDTRLAPLESIRKAYGSLLKNKNFIKQLGYSLDYKGDFLFREELCKYLKNTRGIIVNANQILITRGSINAFYLAIACFLRKDRIIIDGKPGYGTIDAIGKLHNATILKVPVDEKGITVTNIEKICKKKKVDMVIVIPHHHYPTTVTLSPRRRMELVALAKKYDFLIIEDDYDYDFHYEGGPVLPLSSLDHGGKVVYVGSFSKTVVPAIRLGFVVASEKLIDQLTIYRRYVDRTSDLIMEKVMLELMRFGELARHNKKAIRIYKQRRDLMHALFQKNFSELFDYQLPQGGMSFWIQLKKKVDHQLIIDRARKRKIYFERYSKIGFRVGFASVNEAELKERIKLLKYIFKDYC